MCSVRVFIFLLCTYHFINYASAQDSAHLALDTNATTTPSTPDSKPEDTITNDTSHSFDTSLSDHSVDNTKIALPLGTWSILDMDENQRVSVCNQQTSYCTNDCGGNQATNLNFCDPKTMNWGCTCQQKIPTSLPFQWPVTVAECNGKEKTCESGCGDGTQADVCRNLCSGYFKCNRPGSEPSKLRLNAAPTTPSPSSSTFIHPTLPASFITIFIIIINI